MKKLIVLLTIVLSTVNLRANDPSILVSPDWLYKNMGNPELVILQTNFMRLDFEKEHIKGARFLWPEWLSFRTPEGSDNPPTAAEATKILQQLGINSNSKIVLCFTRTDVSITARSFITLEYLGLKGRVYFLDGGLEAWKKAGYPTASGPGEVKKGNYVARIDKAFVDKDYVLAALNSPDKLIVDARVKRFYDGDPTGNPRDGHISGAKNIPYVDMIDSASLKFKPAEALQNYFKAVVSDKQKQVIAYCFVGQTASVLYMAGRLLGYDMRVYDGSVQEWSRYENLPMEKTKKD